MRAKDRQTLVGRAEMALIGALAGLAMWVLIEKAQDVLTNPHVFVTVVSAVAGFFSVLLALCGPANLRRGAAIATVLALPAAALLGWASLRFDSLQAFVGAGHLILAWGVLLFVGTPFLAVALEDTGKLRSYSRLFDAAWGIVVRYSTAWLFVAVFWGVVFLSDALLQIVGVTLIEDLLDFDPVPFGLSGLMLGLGLAVVHEMRAYVSPFLVLRLLRLLVPVMLGVVVVFVVAFVLRDQGALFGDLSPAATLLAVALGMISLVSVALDKRDSDAVRIGWMRGATAMLALLLPVIGGLAAYAIWLRVGDHGWTPARLLSVAVAGFVMLYGLCYGGAVILRGPWMERIRRANVRIAGAILLVSAIWMTPVLNVESISANSQAARLLDGRVGPDKAALWEMAHDWGKAGEAALQKLSQVEGDRGDVLRAAITAARTAPEPAAPATEAAVLDARAGALHALIRVVPQGETLRLDMLANLPGYRVEEWLDLCRARPDPGCVLVLEDFDPARPGTEGVLLLPGRDIGYEAVGVRVTAGRLVVGQYIGDYGAGVLDQAQVAAVLRGEYRVAPSSRKSLWIGETEISPQN